MTTPVTGNDLLPLVRDSGVLDEARFQALLERLGPEAMPAEPDALAALLVREKLLTRFQADQLLQGKKALTLGSYVILDRLGAGSMGSVFLCEHRGDKRKVAVKVLPPAEAKDEAALKRFFREFRATCELDHPNIVRSFEIGEDKKAHFLVMEYVDGASLHQIVTKKGALPFLRAANYIRQVAAGLQYIHEKGLIHRDIKPGNLLINRAGVAKVLDLGLARFAGEGGEVLTQGVIGTPDYLAPEQARDSHTVDIRADIYSLGATFYFLLTGATPLPDGPVAKKLIWLQTRQPKPVRVLKPEVPEGLVSIVEKMLAKDPAQRYQTPGDVVNALLPWSPDGTDQQPAAGQGTTVTESEIALTPTVPSSSNTGVPGAPPSVFRSSGPKTVTRSGPRTANRGSELAPPADAPAEPAAPAPSGPGSKPERAAKKPSAATAVPPKPAPAPLPSRRAKRSPWPMLLGVLLLVAAAAVIGWVFFHHLLF